MLQALIDVFSEDSDFKSIAAGVTAGMREQLISGLSGSSRQILLAALHQEQQRPLLVVTHNMFSAQKIADDLQEALSSDQVLLYPANELVAAESAVSSPETLAQRIDVLVRCAEVSGVLLLRRSLECAGSYQHRKSCRTRESF